MAGNWWAASLDFDPLTVAQNRRITFQEKGRVEGAHTAELTPAERRLAEIVLEEPRAGRAGASELLYVGNSQSMAIMDAQADDLTSPQWLQVLLARRAAAGAPEVDVQLGSLPNLSMVEALIALVAAVEAHRVDVFLGAQVLEEFRGLSVRDEMRTLAGEPPVAGGLRRLLEENRDLPAARRALAPLLAASTQPSGESEAAGLARGLEQAVDAVAERLPLFAHRIEMRQHVALSYTALRNRVLGIHSYTTRPVPEASYRASLELLELLLRYGGAERVRTALYLAPIRPIEPNPNVPADVARFRRDVPALASRYGVACFDYIDLVPEELWTNYPDDDPRAGGERDFAHFTGKAHRLLAEALLSDLGAAGLLE